MGSGGDRWWADSDRLETSDVPATGLDGRQERRGLAPPAGACRHLAEVPHDGGGRGDRLTPWSCRRA